MSTCARGVTPPLVLSCPGAIDMVIYRGDTGRCRLTFVEAVDNAPIDVTSASWRCVIRETVDSQETMAVFDIEPVTDIPEAIELVLPAEQSASLDGNGVWDLEMTLNGRVQTMLSGRMILTRDVSRQ